MKARKTALSALLLLITSFPLARADDSVLTPGPCLEKRKQVQVYLDKARQAGIGTKPYSDALTRIESDIKSGAPAADIERQVTSLTSALTQQVSNLKALKVRPPGYLAVTGSHSSSAASAGSKAQAQAPTQPTDSEMESYMLNLVNKHRQDAGLGRVSGNADLAKIARAHAHDMATRNFFSHINPDGKDPQERANAAGFTAMVRENIAFTNSRGGLRPTEIADVSLMNSPPHRANILSPNVSILGIGIAYDTAGGIKVCQLFSQ